MKNWSRADIPGHFERGLKKKITSLPDSIARSSLISNLRMEGQDWSCYVHHKKRSNCLLYCDSPNGVLSSILVHIVLAGLCYILQNYSILRLDPIGNFHSFVTSLFLLLITLLLKKWIEWLFDFPLPPVYLYFCFVSLFP